MMIRTAFTHKVLGPWAAARSSDMGFIGVLGILARSADPMNLSDVFQGGNWGELQDALAEETRRKKPGRKVR